MYETLDGLTDQFIETMSGSKGGVPNAKDNFTLVAENYKSKENVIQFLDEFVVYLNQDVPQMIDPQKDTDLLNIRDEILGAVNKTKYLLRLK